MENYTENVSLIEKNCDNTLYLVHFQADKDYLIKEGYGIGKGSKVLTIHEAQGLTFDKVLLMRLNSKPLMLYDKLAYSIVAISRHRKEFVYYSDVYDVTSRLIDVSVNEDSESLRVWNRVNKARDSRAG